MEENPEHPSGRRDQLMKELKGLSPTPKTKPLIQDEEIKDLLRNIFQRLQKIDKKQDKILNILNDIPDNEDEGY